MTKKKNSALKKNHEHHYVEAHNTHFEQPMEISEELVEQGLIHPLDADGIITDQLIQNITENLKD